MFPVVRNRFFQTITHFSQFEKSPYAYLDIIETRGDAYLKQTEQPNISTFLGIMDKHETRKTSPLRNESNAVNGVNGSRRTGTDEHTPSVLKLSERKRFTGSHITRNTLSRSIHTERDTFLKRSLDEKRKDYKCGKNFKTIKDVITWTEYYNENVAQETRKQILFEINEDLNRKVSLWRGDITQLEIDAIVNAANNSLLGGGGVDGAIHRAAGSHLRAECSTLNGCDTGDAKTTAGYYLPAKYIIHTVGPIGENAKALGSCYRRCLQEMADHDIRTAAFPCISTGIYGYPNDKAAHVALKTARLFLESNAQKVDRIIFCLFLPCDVKIYEDLMQIYFPLEDTKRKNSESQERTDIKTKKDSHSLRSSPSKQASSKETSSSKTSKVGGKESQQSSQNRDSADRNSTEGEKVEGSRSVKRTTPVEVEPQPKKPPISPTVLTNQPPGNTKKENLNPKHETMKTDQKLSKPKHLKFNCCRTKSSEETEMAEMQVTHEQSSDVNRI